MQPDATGRPSGSRHDVGRASDPGDGGAFDLTRLLLDSVRDYAIFLLDVGGRVTSWNAGAQRMKGYAADEIIGRHFSTFYTREAVDAGWPDEELRVASRDGRIEDEGWRVRKDGSRFWANIVIIALRDEGGTLRGFGKVTRDVTERRLLEQAAIEAAETERRRLSYELHDDLGQRLAGASVIAYTLETRLRNRGDSEATSAARLGEILRETLAHARALSHALAPVDLLAEGLDSALDRLCRSASATYGIRCRVDIGSGTRVADPAVATGLYRIGKEAVDNAARHARASEIVVGLTRRPGEICLSVRDDGGGIPRDAVAGRTSGLGLRAMRSRAAALGGLLTIAGDDGGTTVTCVLPSAMADA